MPCGREQHHGLYVGCKNKFQIGFPVEEENELMLGMCSGNPVKSFVGEPPNALQFVLYQETSVYCYSHCPNFWHCKLPQFLLPMIYLN